MNGGARRHAAEKSKLVKAEAQGDADFEIERFGGLAGLMGDEEVEQTLPAERAESEFGGEGGFFAGMGRLPLEPRAETGMEQV